MKYSNLPDWVMFVVVLVLAIFSLVSYNMGQDKIKFQAVEKGFATAVIRKGRITNFKWKKQEVLK